jgi:glycosyltransferase involved in cell wall biosynthesis
MKNSVLFLTNAYPDFDSSYRGIFIKKMAILLKDEGYEISIVTPKIYGASHYFEEHNGIKVYRFPFFAGDKLLIEHKRIPYLRMILYYITGLFLSIYAMFKNRCNLVHVHWAIPTGLIGVGVAFLSRKPFMVTIHGSDLRLAKDESSFLKRIFLYVCKRANHIHCVSEGMRRELEDLKISRGRMSAFPMGIEIDFLSQEGGQRTGFDNRPTTILSNRNLLPIYNVSLFIRAMPLVLREESKVKFLVAGDGPERGELEKEAKNLRIGDFVQFLGRIPHDVMLNLLRQTDIYVSTSLHDGTSVSLLEALGSGAFPVVTDIPSNREWISDGENGFLVPTDKEGALATQIIKAIRNKSLAEKARQKNVRLVSEKVLWPITIEKTKRIYGKVLSS